MKKVFLILGLVISVILSGDILLVLTRNGIVANWGSFIIPSFAAGMIINFQFDGIVRSRVSRIAAISITAVKLVLFLIMVNEPTILAIILIIAIYSAISYLFINLGRILVEYKKRGNSHSDSEKNKYK